MADDCYRCRPPGIEEEERPASEDGCSEDGTDESMQTPAAASRREGVDRVHEGRVHFSGGERSARKCSKREAHAKKVERKNEEAEHTACVVIENVRRRSVLAEKGWAGHPGMTGGVQGNSWLIRSLATEFVGHA